MATDFQETLEQAVATTAVLGSSDAYVDAFNDCQSSYVAQAVAALDDSSTAGDTLFNQVSFEDVSDLFTFQSEASLNAYITEVADTSSDNDPTTVGITNDFLYEIVQDGTLSTFQDDMFAAPVDASITTEVVALMLTAEIPGVMGIGTLEKTGAVSCISPKTPGDDPDLTVSGACNSFSYDMSSAQKSATVQLPYFAADVVDAVIKFPIATNSGDDFDVTITCAGDDDVVDHTVKVYAVSDVESDVVFSAPVLRADDAASSEEDDSGGITASWENSGSVAFNYDDTIVVADASAKSTSVRVDDGDDSRCRSSFTGVEAGQRGTLSSGGVEATISFEFTEPALSFRARRALNNARSSSSSNTHYRRHLDGEDVAGDVTTDCSNDADGGSTCVSTYTFPATGGIVACTDYDSTSASCVGYNVVATNDDSVGACLSDEVLTVSWTTGADGVSNGCPMISTTCDATTVSVTDGATAYTATLTCDDDDDDGCEYACPITSGDGDDDDGLSLNVSSDLLVIIGVSAGAAFVLGTTIAFIASKHSKSKPPTPYFGAAETTMNPVMTFDSIPTAGVVANEGAPSKMYGDDRL